MFKKVSLSTMIFTYLFAGLAHFFRYDYYLSLQPSFMPFPGVMVKVAGVAMILMGASLAWSKTRRAGCYAILIFWATGMPIGLYIVWVGGAGIPLSQDVLIARIPFHLGLMAWALWHSFPEKAVVRPPPSVLR